MSPPSGRPSGSLSAAAASFAPWSWNWKSRRARGRRGWAHDDDEAARLQLLLLTANCSVRSASGPNSESRVLDIDIGYEAFDAVKVLLDAGYSFRWHPDQYAMNRRPTLFGFPIVDPDDEWQQEADERESSVERLQELEADEHFNAAWDADQPGT